MLLGTLFQMPRSIRQVKTRISDFLWDIWRRWASGIFLSVVFDIAPESCTIEISWRVIP